MTQNNEVNVADYNLKPWMEPNDRGWLLCMMCPCYGRPNYFLGIRLKKATRKKMSNWLETHRHCGFKPPTKEYKENNDG